MAASKKALAVLAEALTKASTTGAGLHLAELHRLRRAALQRSGASAKEVQASFELAIDVARDQPAKTLELRASMRTARLWRDQGQRIEACDLLAPIASVRQGARHNGAALAQSANDNDLQIAKRDLGKILDRIETVNKPTQLSRLRRSGVATAARSGHPEGPLLGSLKQRESHRH